MKPEGVQPMAAEDDSELLEHRLAMAQVDALRDQVVQGVEVGLVRVTLMRVFSTSPGRLPMALGLPQGTGQNLVAGLLGLCLRLLEGLPGLPFTLAHRTSASFSAWAAASS